MRVNVLYDQAFVDRFGSDYMNILQSVFSNNTNGISIGSVLKDNFGISLKTTYTSTAYQSLPYVQNCEHKNDINTICKDCKDISNDDDVTECQNGLHHKSETHMIDEILNSYLSDSSNINILFTGQITCHYVDETNEETLEHSRYHSPAHAYGWGTINGNRILILTYKNRTEVIYDLYDNIIRTTTHEILHNLGVQHCDKNNLCIMVSQTQSITANLSMCTSCCSTANANKIHLYNHQ